MCKTLMSKIKDFNFQTGQFLMKTSETFCATYIRKMWTFYSVAFEGCTSSRCRYRFNIKTYQLMTYDALL